MFTLKTRILHSWPSDKHSADRHGKAYRLACWFSLVFAALEVGAQMTPESQAQPQTHEPSPREVVERLWSNAMQGDLLHPEGFQRTARLFDPPGPSWETKSFKVFSNEYWVDRPRFSGTTAKVVVLYNDIGTIDSALRFKPTPTSGHEVRYGMDYSLTFAPSRTKMYAADGKTLLKEVEGLPEWRLGTPAETQLPWTSVNSAIRYVLERRNKTSDPAIKNNADRTIVTLLKYH
jgi:hypothetical protein